jgi:hypothetical protein
MTEMPERTPRYGKMPDDTYTAYRDERNRLTDAENNYAKDFDKYVLMLSGGAIALSIAFLRDLVGDAAIRNAGLLIGAWVFLALAAGMVVFGLYLNPISQRKFRNILDEQAQEGGEKYWARVRDGQQKCWLPKIINSLNVLSVAAFLLGLFLLLWFAYGSVKSKGPDMNKPDNDIRGVHAEAEMSKGIGPALAPVDRLTTSDVTPDGRAGAAPPLGPVDRVTVTPGDVPSPGPTTPPTDAQPPSPPASTNK